MSQNSKKEYLNEKAIRYHKSDKEEKKKIGQKSGNILGMTDWKIRISLNC